MTQPWQSRIRQNRRIHRILRIGDTDVTVARLTRNVNRKILLLIGALLACGVASLPLLTHTTNCGGNCAARANCAIVAASLAIEPSRHPDGTISFLDPSPELRRSLPGLARQSWLPDARFLVLAEPFYSRTSLPRLVVYVCDRPYSNVPECLLFSAPPTHAAVYSDGSMALISTSDFAALDFSRFRDLKELYPGVKSE